MTVVILPYHAGSKSAKLLSQHTGYKRMRLVGSKLNPKTTLVINWGNSQPPFKYKMMLNGHTRFATDKLMALQNFAAVLVCCPPFTTDPAKAMAWLKDGERVFARTILNGHSGKGIVNLIGKDVDLPKAPLYVLYIKKKAEYRVHVVANKGVLIQQKKKRQGAEILDKYIRSHHNGYIFCKNDLNPPPGLEELAIRAINALGLDFGAVDIIHGYDGLLYVLEVNTAPGLDNSTAEAYANGFKNLINP